LVVHRNLDTKRRNRMAKEINKEKPKELLQPKIQSAGQVPGFEIPAGDPYISSVIRYYQKVSKKPLADPNARPFVLLANDPATIETLENYILRAAGACDVKRADIARAALEKFTQLK